MSGAPIKNVCEVLRDIYNRTKIEYPLFSYNTVTNTTTTIKSVEKTDLVASGGTSFSSIFNAIKDHLLKNVKPTTFIFMTDGQDSEPNGLTLKKSIEALKLAISAMKSISITFHVIGFGSVDDSFLNKVREFGTKHGLLKYSTQSAELQNNFNDMFEYATSSREFSIKINGNTYTSSSNDETVGFLVNDVLEGSSEITLKSDVESKIMLEPLNNIRSIHMVKALNLMSPENEESVREILTHLHSIIPTDSNLMERLEVEQIKREINDRMMEYIKIFTQIKMGQVPEQVKLKLSALRHDATFANSQRKKKLDLRVNRNVEYFQKTDISGILDGYKKNIDQQGWEKIKEQKAAWVCTYSSDDIYEMMRKAADNILCLGILIERNEEAITSPTKGLNLISVSNTIISYDSFIAAMSFAKKEEDKKQTEGINYGDFSRINDTYCVVGAMHEKINAVIPLYINYEHMKRIRILEGIWLGYLFTLDSYGYDKNQEIGLLKLLYDIIISRTETTRNKQILVELEKVCHFIITESVGFKSAYGETTYDNFVASIHGRNSTYNLCIPLMIGYLKNDIKNVVMPVYYEYIRQCFCTRKDTDTTDIIKRLLYGSENKTMTIVTNENVDYNQDDPDYVEKSFIQYFHDEMNKPIQLISEVFTGQNRKLIAETDIDYIKSLLSSKSLSVPIEIKNMLKYCNMDENYVEDNIDYDDMRKELLMMLSFGIVPAHVNKSNIYHVADEKSQGSSSNLIKLDLTPENIRVVTYKITNTKTLEGFGGLMRKYCPERHGEIFTEVIKSLLSSSVSQQCEGSSISNKDKLIALLTNQVGYSPLYNNLRDFCWQPLKDVDINVLRQIVGVKELKKIEDDNSGKKVVHCYRISNKENRHGYGNYYPNMRNIFKFISYSQRQ
ncbi:unnamed protein product [Didymodactylos carnosus]|uniref:VWFA domain-containing protein n=1 Tax=Didymodactylos carnosus TaxID=1234261 RepID=A0A8S2ERK0_9BILA|nr:unnamed protein product [Didymodactylos carnosus]CAF4095300.1 unnamed protein product [Didymodactylos carnosus]